MLPPGPPLRVDDLVAPNANPVMRAAGPLLLLLGRLRVALMRASFASLMEQVADAIKFFEKDIRPRAYPSTRPTPRNTSCAPPPTISCSTSRPRSATSGRNIRMLSRFFGERVGGVRFFEILDHLKLDPLVNYPVLELQHACLALGFQGIHRTSAGGLANLQLIQRNLYEIAAPGPAEDDERPVAALARPGAGGAPAASARSGLARRGCRRRAADRVLSSSCGRSSLAGQRMLPRWRSRSIRPARSSSSARSLHRRRRRRRRRHRIASPSCSASATRSRRRTPPVP